MGCASTLELGREPAHPEVVPRYRIQGHAHRARP